MKLNVQLSTELDLSHKCTIFTDLQILNENLKKTFVNCPMTARLLFFYFYNFMRKKIK
jgi:hypothetical protein